MCLSESLTEYIAHRSCSGSTPPVATWYAECVWAGLCWDNNPAPHNRISMAWNNKAHFSCIPHILCGLAVGAVPYLSPIGFSPREQLPSRALPVTMTEGKSSEWFHTRNKVLSHGSDTSLTIITPWSTLVMCYHPNQKGTRICNPTIHTEGREPKTSGELNYC